MGQKINPIGFRLGTTQGHHSLWFAQPKNYFEGLQEDQKIRNYIKNYVQKNMKTSSSVEGIARIEIQKRIDLIQIIIYMGFPKILIESRPRGIEELQMNLQKEFNYVNQLNSVYLFLTGLCIWFLISLFGFKQNRTDTLPEFGLFSDREKH